MTELSPAVERVLDAARALAGDYGSEVVLPVHLLHALVHDESRAHAALMAAGCTLEDLQEDFPLERSGDAYDAAGPADMHLTNAVLRQARRWLREIPGDSEVRTEHLLAALAIVDPQVGKLFERFGLTPDAVRGADSAESHEPIDIDEPPRETSQVTSQTSEAGNGVRGATGSASAVQIHAALRSAPTADVLRILDAAANRGREGLRVVEDAARFVLNDPHLCGLLKSLRHELAAALQQLGGETFHVQRDTTGDVGTALSTASEADRESFGHVLLANCKRVEESLRTLEEYGKLIDPHAAATIEQLRYRFYTLEKALLTTASSRQRLADCRLYLLVTASACGAGFERVVKSALDGGVDGIQLREKSGDDRRLLQLAEQVREWTSAAGALFIINDRPDVAVLTGADGVHVGQEDLSVQHVRRFVGTDQLVGVSTHSIEQARQAVLDGADYLGVGPTFPSQTKQFDSFAGLDFVRAVAAEIALPWFAIGGITPDNVAQVIEAGATRLAVSGAVCTADDPTNVATALHHQLQSPQ